MASPPLPNSPGWLDAAETAEWIETWGFQDPQQLRQSGAILLRFQARDRWSAVDQAAADVERITARFRVGARRRLEFYPFAYVLGEPERLAFDPQQRRVQIHALERTLAIFEPRLPEYVDAALELVEPLESGPTAPAITGAWASLESLLIGPGDEGNRVVAATRMARIVACSYVRAEFTSLANAYMTDHNDQLAIGLKTCTENKDRALSLEAGMRGGSVLPFKRTRHQAAASRMSQAVTAPNEVLPRVVQQIEDAFRRLYRQRNLVVHAGQTGSIAARGTLLTVPPLVGAGIDRVVHAAATAGTRPLELAALAEVRLGQARQGSVAIADLLG
jgi:hypothetical protein